MIDTDAAGAVTEAQSHRKWRLLRLGSLVQSLATFRPIGVSPPGSMESAPQLMIRSAG